MTAPGTTNGEVGNEVAILARVLGNEQGRLPRQVARYLLTLRLSDEDKARMHVLAMRNQQDDLDAEEKEELHALAKAATLLSLLKSRARQALGPRSRKPASS